MKSWLRCSIGLIGTLLVTLAPQATYAAWDLSTASYASISYNTNTQAPTPFSVDFSSDGLSMYVMHWSTSIFQYTLGTAWNVSTASYANKSKNVNTGNIRGASFSSDGTKVFVADAAVARVYQYSMGTPWDISTAGSGTYISISSQQAGVWGVNFKTDGTKMYIVGDNAARVHQYTLSTPWDVTSATYDSKFASISQDTAPSKVAFKSDGTKMYVLGFSNKKVYQYTLSTPWDVSTASYDSVALDLASQASSFRAFNFKTDGSKLYAAGYDSHVVYQYSVGASDTTAPSVSLTLPVASEATTTTVRFAASASDDTGVSGVKFFVNGLLQGSEITSAPYILDWDSTATTSGSKSVVAVARDAAGNVATSSAVVFSTSNGPTPSSIATTTLATSATITWNTSIAASSRVWFGLTSSYSTSTPETNTSPRVTSHSVTLSNLPACTTFHYAVTGKNAGVEYATSSDATFRTAGCTADAPVVALAQGTITTGSGGTLSHGILSVSVPSSFTATSSSVTFQASQLDRSTFFTGVSAPIGKETAATAVYHLHALTDATTTLPTFTQPLQITLSYEDADISGIAESSLWIYRYDNSVWTALDSCTVDTTLNTVTCTTQAFSDFALFGNAPSTGSVRRPPSTGSIQNQVQNLLAMGNAAAAEKIMQQWPNLFPKKITPVAHAALIATSSPSPTSPLATTTQKVRNLTKGMQGTDVSALQTFLIAADSGPSARELARVGVSGYFGVYTKNALGEYQKSQGITPSSGYFGEVTRAHMKKIMLTQAWW